MYLTISPSLLCLFVFHFSFQLGSLHVTDWPGTPCIDQANLELTC